MLTVGIYVNYVRGEAALAATMLADWLLRLGVKVRFLSDGVVSRNIHPYWDRQVVRALKPEQVYNWAYGCTHLCWFEPSHFAFAEAQLVTTSSRRRRTRHLFFPRWGSWQTQHEDFLQAVDRTIVFSRQMADWLDHRYGLNTTQRTWGVLTSPVEVLQGRYGRLRQDQTSLLVVLPQQLERDLGRNFLPLFNELLQQYSGLHLQFLMERSLSKTYRKQLKTLLQHPRTQLHLKPDYTKYSQLSRNCDWTYLVSTRHPYGSTLAALLPGTTPVITANVSPASEHIMATKTGVLLPCKTLYQPLPVAELQQQDVRDTLDMVLAKSETWLQQLQAASVIVLRQRQQKFAEFLQQEFMR